MVFSDPTGLRVEVASQGALELIRETLPPSIRGGIVLDANGAIDVNALNKIQSLDPNFLALKTLAVSEVLVVVSTGSRFIDNSGTDAEFLFESVESLVKELAESVGQKSAEDLISAPNLFLGGFNPPGDSPSGNAQVIISNGTGAAATAPRSELVLTTAHELFGHALLFVQGKPFRHDGGGPVDKAIKAAEDRTRKNFQ